jgi:hypothetical protein
LIFDSVIEQALNKITRQNTPITCGQLLFNFFNILKIYSASCVENMRL